MGGHVFFNERTLEEPDPTKAIVLRARGKGTAHREKGGMRAARENQEADKAAVKRKQRSR